MRRSIIALVLLAFCKISCRSTSSEAPLHELKGVKIITTEISSSAGEMFKVKSFVYDSCVIENSSTTQVGVNKQKLFFIKHGVQVAKAENPIINATYVQANCNDSLRVIECPIYEIGILEGSKGEVFSIKGAGLYNASPELFAFYDMNGNCVWLNYSNQYKIYKSVGDYDSICNKIGVDTSLWLNGRYKKANIDL